jgi:hypothetical protein
MRAGGSDWLQDFDRTCDRVKRMLMLDVLLNALFGCSHKRTTFPCTPIPRSAPSNLRATRGTYVVCLNCGQEFSYDWQEMRMGEPVSALRYTRIAESFAPTPELSLEK